MGIFSSAESRNVKKKCFSVSKLHFSRAFMGKSLQKSEKRYPCKTHFSKIGRKMSTRGPPTPIFVDWKFFYLNFVKKKFSRSGTLKIDDFGPFFKNKCSKFLPTRKKRVFRVVDFFEKSRECFFFVGGGCAPICFFTKTC